MLGISIDTPERNRKWAEKLGLPFRLLSDDEPLGKVGKLYGVWDATWNFDGRATFVIDKKGVIRHKYAGPITQQWVDQTLLPLIKELQRG